MQVKFAYAATSNTKGGEASIGVAARAVAGPANETAAIVSLGPAGWMAACPAPLDQDKQNKKQAASRLSDHARPARSHRLVPSRTSAPAIFPTRTGRARMSTRGYGGIFSLSVLPAAQAALEIGATILAGGVRAGKGMPSALDAWRYRAGSQAGSSPACRRQEADFAPHGEARASTLVPEAALAAFDAKKCAASIETPKTLMAMTPTHASARMALITLDVRGDSRDGAITLHDFKDSVRAVLDVVEV
ncbi:hypothetical protein C0Z18_28195 [Trinickia dabaoshanensis]|uniref:Uncharacterized protein n=1 Tax=Trinickia dabaoshanensis TaxID=564714 RepID=A0A2N7VDH7_9BURK|nr:hypothetical protein [Trinickia dabaoshanensis]PMS15202.1 hypothetical protein C0Z18_28195 [Trinickia dabaoshanensis]